MTGPGQYLLTGSARLLGLRSLPDALVGRAETIELWPFSQGEIDSGPDGFIDSVFNDGGPALVTAGALGRHDYLTRAVRGGFPSPSGTVERYVSLFEEVFLIKRISAWSNRATNRATRLRKLIFVDSGLGSHLGGLSLSRLARDPARFGPVLENFVIAELARQLTWSNAFATLHHYRTRDGQEVDAVIEHHDGRVVGVEVKASSTVSVEDFRHLVHLRDRAGTQFLHGLVLHTGTDILSFGDRLTAAPIDSLWRSSPPDAAGR